MDSLKGIKTHTESTPETVDKELTKRELELTMLPIQKSIDIGGGTNTVHMVFFDDMSKGIFKPGDGEEPLEIEESNWMLYKRERAAYLVSRSLKFNFVPATILREVGGRHGSIQDFVKDPKQNLWDLDESEMPEGELFALAIFDYLIWNKDRKNENFFIRSGKIQATDNGLSFDNWSQYLISGNLKRYVADQEVPHGLLSNLSSFVEDDGKRANLKNQLTGLIPEKTIEAMFKRIEKTVKLLSRGIITRQDIQTMHYSAME